jgi:hypothetical protein
MVSGQGGSEAATNPAIHTIEVTPGLFDDVTGRVEISGTGLTAGEQVEVPES